MIVSSKNGKNQIKRDVKGLRFKRVEVAGRYQEILKGIQKTDVEIAEKENLENAKVTSAFLKVRKELKEIEEEISYFFAVVNACREGEMPLEILEGNMSLEIFLKIYTKHQKSIGITIEVPEDKSEKITGFRIYPEGSLKNTPFIFNPNSLSIRTLEDCQLCHDFAEHFPEYEQDFLYFVDSCLKRLEEEYCMRMDYLSDIER